MFNDSLSRAVTKHIETFEPYDLGLENIPITQRDAERLGQEIIDLVESFKVRRVFPWASVCAAPSNTVIEIHDVIYVKVDQKIGWRSPLGDTLHRPFNDEDVYLVYYPT